MIWLKRTTNIAQEEVREAEPAVREMLTRIEENGEDLARAMTFAFFLPLVVLLIAYLPVICTAMLPDIYK
jgi:hypothetical protein